MATAAFPHHYTVALDARGGLTAEACPRIDGGPPPQFGGDGRHWGPEHLLVGAAALCLMTTFRSLAERDALEVVAYRSRAEGVLDKTREGLIFTAISLSVELDVRPGDEERARQVLARAKKYCIVSNALRCPVEVVPVVRTVEVTANDATHR